MARVSELRLRCYVAAVFAAGLAFIAGAGRSVDPGEAAAFVATVALAELLPVRFRHGVVVTLNSVVFLTALVVDGPALAVVAALGVPLAGWRHYAGRRAEKTLFNFGQFTLSVAAASAVFVALGGQPGRPGAPLTWVALLAAGGAFTLVNYLLVAGAIRLAQGESVRSAVDSLLASAMLQVLYAAVAIVAAALMLEAGLASLLLLVVPALVARHSLLGYQREAEAYDRLVNALLKAIEVKDGYTAGHVDRVSTLCTEVARELGMSYEEVRAVQYAAKLHDVGKLGVPSAIINKPGRLDDEEFALIKEHPTIGAEILGGIEFLSPALDGVRYHHERVDGAGYPHGLAADDLPMVARIITVCDAFDAMTTTRSYRRAMPIEDAFVELRRCAGSQFDGAVVDVLGRVTDRLGWTTIDEPYAAPAPVARLVPSPA